MAYFPQYRIQFKTLHADDLLQVLIYEEANSGSTVLDLKGASEPIITEEDDDEDLFKPVRTQTGYVRIVDDGTAGSSTTFNWETLLPSDYPARPIVLQNAYNINAVLWRGFIQMQQPESTIYEMPVERQFAIYDILGVLEYVDFNIGIESTTTNSYVNFAYIIKRIVDLLPSVVRPANFYFQGGNYVNAKLLAKVNPMHFIDIEYEDKEPCREGVRYSMESISALKPKYTCMEVLEEVCKFWGYSCRTYGGDLYFTQDVVPSGTGHAQFRKFSYTQMGYMAAGTSSGTNEENPDVMSGLILVSTENNISGLQPLQTVLLTADVGERKELMQFFPDQPRKYLAKNPSWNSDDAPLRFSMSISRYVVGSHRYGFENPSTLPGNIFGMQSDAEKWGMGEKYTYTYCAGGVFRTNSTSGDTAYIELASRFPFTYADCRLSIKATLFWENDGNEMRLSPEESDTWGPVGTRFMRMRMLFYHTNGNQYYWTGDQWQTFSGAVTNAGYFWARVGGTDGYMYPLSSYYDIDNQHPVILLPERAKPRKYITFDTISTPVGRVVIRFEGIKSETKIGLADVVVEVDRIPMPAIIDSPNKEIEYKPAVGTIRTIKTSIPQNEWSEDVMFASEDYSQFGTGTVLNADDTPLTTMQMNAEVTAIRPEQWVVDMVKKFRMEAREILSTEMNRASENVAKITPRSRISNISATWYPFSISHYWRDDVKKIKAVTVWQNTTTYTVRLTAGTGIASVSPGISTQVYSGDMLSINCALQSGYVFMYWRDANNAIVTRDRAYTITNIRSNMQLTAIATEDTRTFTVTLRSATGITSVSGGGTYRIGTVVTISCTLESDYNFVGWCENDYTGPVISTSPTFQLTVNRDITLYPYAESATGDLRLFFGISEPGWGRIRDNGTEPNYVYYVNGEEYEALEGELLNLTAVPAAGYEFVKWQKNGVDYSTDATISYSVDENEDVLTAVFKVQTVVTSHTLYITGNINDVRVEVEINNNTATTYKFGSGSGYDAAPLTEIPITVPVGATVKLTASYNGFSVVDFQTWTNEYTSVVSQSNPYTFQMNADTHLSANYN